MKILVIRFSSIGDIVLTSPVLRALSEQLDSAEIHFLTKPGFTEIVANNPRVTRVWPWSSSVLSDLRKEKFDYVIDLHHNLRSARVKWALMRPSASFHKLNVEKYLKVRFGYDRLPRIHIVDRYLAAASAVGVKPDGKGLEFYPTGGAEKILRQLPETFLPNYLALVCGALKGTKQIPEERLAAIVEQAPGPVVLLGGKAEIELGQRLAQRFGQKVMNFCGATSLSESAILLRESKVVVTADTGLMHIAAAFSKPIVSIWGNTIPEFGMYPYMPQFPHLSHVAEVKELSCRPCSKIGFQTCPKGHFRCMQQQDYVGISAKIAGWMAD